MNLIGNYMKSHMNNYLKRLSIKNKTNLNNNNKNIKESPIDSFSKFSNIINNKNNSKNDISEYSNENSDDINYISSPYLKDKILSPGDDDICLPKQSSPPKDNPQGYDDICLYNI